MLKHKMKVLAESCSLVMVSVVDKITLVTETQLVHDAHFLAFLYLVSSYSPYQRREKEGKKL
jgi:hypothetical protein